MSSGLLLTREKYADVPTERVEAVTRALHEQPTEKAPVLLLLALDTYDLRLLFDCAREDGVTPRTFIRRLLTVEYHRRMIGREVEAMERSESHG